MNSKNKAPNQNKWIKISEFFNDFLSLVYPNLCLCCEIPLVKQEHFMCAGCDLHLPRSHYHLVSNNPVEHLFWGRTSIEKATSYFIFQKGSKYQKLLHHLKYKGYREIGVELGKRFAAELNQVSYFDEIDVLVPVPLHPKKEKQRGYNQSTAIAEGMAQILHKELNTNNLQRKYYSETQTRKGRYERWENVNELFAVKEPKYFTHKHVLLIDDVVTTGSTLEACANALLQCEGTKVSIATLAYASY
ncbi:MAG TPA: phosphoribosyltransferase family protein [Prolixibacteraceae bacterium]|nr:phosphoribosyltransferase family protein [Prolixibacteraceae bacterium]